MLRAVATLALAVLAAPAFAAGHGVVDAAARVVRCEGRAAPRLHEEAANVSVTRLRTERAARDAAGRACLAGLRGLRAGEDTVGGRLDHDPVLARAVADVVRSLRPADAPRLFSDGGVALRLVLPLDGKVSRLLLGRDTWTLPLPIAGS